MHIHAYLTCVCMLDLVEHRSRETSVIAGMLARKVTVGFIKLIFCVLNPKF